MAVREEKRFKVSRIEVDSREINYTYKTLETIKSIDSNSELYFITGADCLMELNTWKEVDRIFLDCSLVVFNRKGYSMEKIISKKEEIQKNIVLKLFFLILQCLIFHHHI